MRFGIDREHELHVQMTTPNRKKPASWKSLVAGAAAGATEAAITYPFEFAKTRLQFRTVQGAPPSTRNPLVLIANTVRQDGVRTLYAGADALIVGTAWKAAVRFLAFDSIKALFADEHGRTGKFGGVCAGLGAGVLESIVAVTPFETVKTALIDDARSANRRYHGFIHGTKGLIKDYGIRGIYRGLVPVTMRQAGNSAVRMGSYNALKGFYNPKTSLGTFGIGALAGVATVIATSPLDVLKTRMQSLSASEYRNSFDCVQKIYKQEGIFAFWRGATPRLGRLILSGGIVFTVYEKVISLID